MDKKHPLVLLHGAVGAKSQFVDLIPLLESYFEVITLDFEGHGTADLTDRPFKIGHFVENVLNIVGPEKFDVFGYSMGGYVALYLALHHPERVGRVFTLATKFDWTLATAEKEVRLLDADKILQKTPHYAQTLQAMHRDWRMVLEKTRDLLIGLGQQNLLTPDILAQITQPVRIAIGDRDSMVSLEETITAYRALQLGELQILPAIPHPFDKISPSLLADAIIQFFTRGNWA
ncbi:MAG: alpha/beta fold hydrolase [Anaerolineae bacterium]|nr:alpha/beta fold hydrolase [Anaerolineae bacterium]